MKMTRRICALLAVLMLCMAVLPAAAENAVLTFYTLGSKVNDFTLTTCKGEPITLSEILKEKDMVLINIWATWCGPCEMEFPYLEEAYQQYKDDVEVIAVSCEASDTDNDLAAYAESHGLTFPIARDTANLAMQFYAASIPTSVVIDRFGTVCFIESGAQTSTDAFARLFDAFVGEGYTESRLLSSIPATRPNIPKAEVGKLAEALNAELTFSNPTDVYTWPMIPAEIDDRLCVMSTNKGVDDTEAALYASVSAKAGDVLAVTFKVSSEAAADLLGITVNGETVKVFGGEKDWMTYAYSIAADGEYTVGLKYVKDPLNSAGEDVVYIDELVVLSGAKAEAALAANPVYPAAGATTLTVANDDARQIVFDDPTYALLSLFGLADYYLVPGGNASFHATLGAAVDPEAAFFVNYYDGSITSVLPSMTADGYAYATAIDSMETTGYTYTNVHLYPSADGAITDVRTVVCFASEENVNEFVAMMKLYGYTVDGWSYIDGSDASTDALTGEGTDALSHYTLTFMDQDGEPVAGVIANVCDESSCIPMTSNAAGVIEFENVPYAYDVHVIKIPDGYEFDMTQAFKTEADGGETVFTLHRTFELE
ncbi:MAG: TlpA family protein disulfide reductase [Clostridia bacterium]|nr:TlpA family protein disulfide reductase [Clostridia bacterium]